MDPSYLLGRFPLQFFEIPQLLLHGKLLRVFLLPDQPGARAAAAAKKRNLIPLTHPDMAPDLLAPALTTGFWA